MNCGDGWSKGVGDDKANPGSDTEDLHDSENSRPKIRRSSDAHDDQPTLAHRLRHDKSILAIALSEDRIYAGTQGGEILVFSLDSYERIAVIEAHRGSVLGLCLYEEDGLLFSTAGDRITNAWDTSSFGRVYSLYSAYDIGDVFCVAYSSSLQTVYIGAQNTTIQWYDLKEKDRRPQPKPRDHPLFREDPFFDSSGPGGIRTPRPKEDEARGRHARGGQVLEIDKSNILHYAHYGYVYCMLLARDISHKAAASEDVLISGGGDGIINVWRLDHIKGGAIEKLFHLDDGREEGHSILSIALEGTFLYSGRSGGEVNVWDLETKQLLRSLKAHRDDVMSICVGGGFLFTAAVTGYVRKYDRQYQCASRLRAHEGSILASGFTVHQRRPLYVTGANDNTLAIWDVTGCVTMPAAARKSTNEQLFEHLRRFVSYKTVSSDPKYKGDCRRGASYLRSVFKSFGATTEMLPTDNSCNPVILARFRGNPETAKQRKKILFYGHYDVVAANNENGKWLTDPFSMEGIDGYLYGRGTSDNKGPIMAAIFACAELTAAQSLGADIVFLIEGEEECGSRGFARAVQQHKELIGNVDWILLANSYWLDDRMPCLTYGLRGVIHASVQVESSHPDLHSGVDGSAQLDESLKDLVTLLSTLTGLHGKVRIPGFYDPIPALSKEEEGLYTDIVQALVARNPNLGDPDELAKSLMRRWREASLTIHRFSTSGPENASIIPRLARAAISLRLVPNQEAPIVAKSLISYLESEFTKLGSHNKLTVTIDHQAEPWLGDVHNQIFQTLEEAVMDVWGPFTEPRRRSSIEQSGPLKVTIPKEASYFSSKPSPTTSTALANGSAMTPTAFHPPSPHPNHPNLSPPASITNPHIPPPSPQKQKQTGTPPRRKPLYIREGGSIPAIRFLEKEFGAPAAHLPCGQASDSAHLDNERLRLVNLYKSKDIFARVFRDLPQK